MLEVRQLHAGYGRIPVLNDVAFTVSDGEVVGILGHNGMGKTTLMRTLMGFIPSTAGSINFAGQEIAALSPYRRARLGLGYVPQGREIFSQLSVRDNLRMGALKAKPGRLEQVLEDFPQLKLMLDRPGGALSGGEQQILAIARGLCAEPKLILLDEPTEGIQPSIVEQIASFLLEHNKSQGLAVIVVEQNLDFILSVASRVLIIQKGAIIRELTTTQLREREILDEFAGVA